MLRCLLRSLALVLVLSPAAASAAPSDVSRYVLPPGNYGGLPKSPHSTDQLSLYSGLTPLRRSVSMADVNRLYLPMNFAPIGATTSEPVGRTDVSVTYDSYGIPHIKGKTRTGLMFGAGWVMARDRGLLFNFGRDPARAAVADIPGLDAFSLVTSAVPFTPSAQAEALVTSERHAARQGLRPEGRQILRDIGDYADGVNAYYRANGLAFPGGRPFDANDLIAVAAFIGSIFGNGGGVEHAELGPPRPAGAEARRPPRARRLGRRHGGERSRGARHHAQALLLPRAHGRQGPRLGRRGSRLGRAGEGPARRRRPPP